MDKSSVPPLFIILAVPSTDPNFDEYRDLDDLPKHFPKEVAHFFTVYKQLQDTEVTNEGWVGAAEAKQAVLEGIRHYRETFPPVGQGV